MANGVVEAPVLVQGEGTADGEVAYSKAHQEGLDEVLIGGQDLELLCHPEEVPVMLLVGIMSDF